MAFTMLLGPSTSMGKFAYHGYRKHSCLGRQTAYKVGLGLVIQYVRQIKASISKFTALPFFLTRQKSDISHLLACP